MNKYDDAFNFSWLLPFHEQHHVTDIFINSFEENNWLIVRRSLREIKYFSLAMIGKTGMHRFFTQKKTPKKNGPFFFGVIVSSMV